jgi:hypothetical protein
MKRVASLLVVGALFGSVVVPGPVSARNRKPVQGVFGTIHGKKFSATNISGAGDPCVNGIYEPSASAVTFGALECRGKRRRQGTAGKRNYKALAIGCRNFDPATNPLTPPYEVPCVITGYSETKTGRFGIPKSMTEWGASVDFSTNPVLPTTSVRVRVDSFDGVNVKGAIFGVFDTALTPDAIPPVEISGEIQFNFPFEIR